MQAMTGPWLKVAKIEVTISATIGGLYCHATFMEGTMTTLEAFLLGMMVAWTPSLILLGWFLLLEDRQNGATEKPA
jgi:hypothetical protein